MSEKNIKARIINKHETEAHWNLATNFIPKQGELIIYDKDENYNYERFKIGDGATNVNDLPFAGADEINTIKSDLANKASIDYVDENKIDKNSIVQGLGNSTTAVMSQEAITIEFARIDELIANLQKAIGGGQKIVWHQLPDSVRNYIYNVEYDPNDYSTTQIKSYAPETAIQSNTKPIGKTVDNITYYNAIPNIETPFASDNASGTLKPLDKIRFINSIAPNVRDLGGWDANGGTIKYGKLFRGGLITAEDRDVFVNELNIHYELSLLGGGAEEGTSVLGNDVVYKKFAQYAWYDLTYTGLWHDMITALFDAVTKGTNVYFHCSAGADRTGTFACIIEGLLGVSQSDIDKDYELTTFYSGWTTDEDARMRNESEWRGLINQINVFKGDTFRKKVASFLYSVGISYDAMNRFCNYMIDGTPEILSAEETNKYTINVSAPNCTVTSVPELSSGSVTVDEGTIFTATITANEGYTIDSVTVNGAEQIISNNGVMINITVSSNISIIATASETSGGSTYTNQIPISTDIDGSIYNGTGYKTATRIKSSGAVVDITPGTLTTFTTGFIPISDGDIIYLSGCWQDPDGTPAEYGTDYGGLNTATYGSDKSTVSYITYWGGTAMLGDYQYDSEGRIIQMTVIHSSTDGYIRLTLGCDNDGSQAILTVNEPII